MQEKADHEKLKAEAKVHGLKRPASKAPGARRSGERGMQRTPQFLTGGMAKSYLSRKKFMEDPENRKRFGHEHGDDEKARKAAKAAGD